MLRAADPDEYLRARRARACSRTSARSATLQARGRRGVRLRQRAARPRRRSTATRTRSPTRASSPPTSGRCSARARARSAGSRCPATRPTSRRPTRRSSTCSATRTTSAAGSSWRASACAFQGLPARICWLGYGERHLAGLRFNEMVASGELRGADRDRARPPRRRLGRLAAARDRGDARRLRRGRRLADPQRAGQHRDRRELGLVPPRRRRRHGHVAARRAGVRGRRHAELAGERIRRTLLADPGMGIVRHVDAGYPEAIDAADRLGVRIPMRE